jgi:hypothetical protein
MDWRSIGVTSPLHQQPEQPICERTSLSWPCQTEGDAGWARSERVFSNRYESRGSRSRVHRRNRRSTPIGSVNRPWHRSRYTSPRRAWRKAFLCRYHSIRVRFGRLGSFRRVRVKVCCKGSCYKRGCNKNSANPYCQERLGLFRHLVASRTVAYRTCPIRCLRPVAFWFVLPPAVVGSWSVICRTL